MMLLTQENCSTNSMSDLYYCRTNIQLLLCLTNTAKPLWLMILIRYNTCTILYILVRYNSPQQKTTAVLSIRIPEFMKSYQFFSKHSLIKHFVKQISKILKFSVTTAVNNRNQVN